MFCSSPEKAPERFDRAAARWHARFVLDAGDVGLAESELVRAALAELRGPGRSAAGEVLAEVGRRHRLLGVEQAARDYLALLDASTYEGTCVR